MAPRLRAVLASLLLTISTAAAQGTNQNLCPFGYIGCYSNGILQDDWTDSIDGAVTIDSCLDVCYGQGYNFGGAQAGNQCWCADNLLVNAVIVADAQCNLNCAGDATELCGGTNVQTVYQLSPEPDSCLVDDGGDDSGDDGGVTSPSSVSATATSSTAVTTGLSSASQGLTTGVISSTTPPFPVSNSTITLPQGPGTGGSGGQSTSLPGGGTGGSSGGAGGASSSPTTVTGGSSGGSSGGAGGASSSPTTVIGGGSGASSVSSATATQATVAPPAPTVSGTTTQCYAWTVVQAGGSCYNIQQQYDIDFSTLQGLNPSLNVQCSNLLTGYAYCVAGVPARLAGAGSTSASSMSNTSRAVSTVSTVAPGQTGARNSFTSNGSVCQYKTYTINVGGVTVGTMSS